MASITDLMTSLEYGPAPEDRSAADKWIKDHGGKFGHFIDNQWVYPEGRNYLPLKAPKDYGHLADTIEGNADDVEVAIQSSVKAQKAWAALTPFERSKHLYNVARLVQKHHRLFDVIEALDNGKTIRETRDADMPTVIRWLYHYAGWAQLMDTEMPGYSPIGVVGGIVPWNFPLMLLVWKLAPALAMGNCIVVKPASYTRLSALLFAEVCAEAGLPPGVFNLITGGGAMGSVLAAHPLVDKVSFTGSTGVGQLLRRLVAGSGKKMSLELGGKSANIIFDSADLDAAVEGVIDGIFFNQGQVCSAGSRILIQDTVYDIVIAKIKRRMGKLRVGDSLDKCMDMGPVVDESQIKTVEEYLQSAREEGCTVFQACEVIPPLSKGLYIAPTLITECETTARVVQEEIFGPVAVALRFRTQKEAIALANQSCYGLGGGVWTEKSALAYETALQIKTGTVWINCYNLFDAAAGFGGYKESGFGRDGGKECLYDNAKPSWMKRARPVIDESKVQAFGKLTPSGPSITGAPSNAQIDHTIKVYIGGKQKRPDAPYTRAVFGPSDNFVGQVCEGQRKDVRDAVEAAHAAADGWGKRAAFNRAQICYYIAENLQLRRAEFAQSLQAMTGREMGSCEHEVDLSIQRLFYWASYADKYGGTVQETAFYGVTAKVHEPVGVVAILCPDESPLLSFVSLFAPAIVRSNTIVIVPSEKHPLCAIDLYQVFDTSDLPAGVVNIITGSRDHLAGHLVDHRDVQAIWYFGSAEGSKAVEHRSADNVKRTWVNYGEPRDWQAPAQGEGSEFLYHSIQVKNIWLPIGESFAN
jgi:aldehyde dehydrogenase (NAD+)